MNFYVEMLTTSLADAKVHMIVPAVMSSTDRYLLIGYLLPSTTIAMIKLAIRPPWN